MSVKGPERTTPLTRKRNPFLRCGRNALVSTFRLPCCAHTGKGQISRAQRTGTTRSREACSGLQGMSERENLVFHPGALLSRDRLSSRLPFCSTDSEVGWPGLLTTFQVCSVCVMSYGYSSAYPRVPNSTPQLPTSIRPPIHNPYDKFTQPQFDEWIGDITSALRKALGQEEEETPTSQAAKPREDAHPVSDIHADDVEDSLAEWKAMRAKEKGKMRATEGEEGSEYGGSQGSHEYSDVRDHAVGNTPGDAIELLSDEDDVEGEEVSDSGEYDNEDNDGGSIEKFSPLEMDGEARRPYVGSSQPTMPSTAHEFPNKTGREGS